MSSSVSPSRSPLAVISRKGVDRVRAGHPWIYRSDVAELHAERGAVVEVRDGRGAFIGRALSSTDSQITLRLLTRTDRPVDRGFWRDRLAAAIAVRDRLGLDGSARRLVHGEADLLPSLVVDQYADVLVVQTLLWSDEVRDAAFPSLDEPVKISSKELDLSKQLVESLVADFEPEQYVDEYQEELRTLIKA